MMTLSRWTFSRLGTPWRLCVVTLALGARHAAGDDSGPPATPFDMSAPAAVKASVPDETPLIVDRIAPPRGQDIDTGPAFPPRPVSPPPTAPADDYPGNLIKGIADPAKRVEVMLNFDAAPLSEVVPLFASLLKFDYLVDPAVKGAVTMTVDSEMTAKEVWDMFEHVLWLSGAYASRNTGVVNVMPFQKMARERRLLARHEPLANVSVVVLPIRFGKSGQLMGHIQPFLTEGATVTDLADLNALLIVESPANMSKIKELVGLLDIRGEADWPQVAVRCRNVDTATIKEELDRLLPVLGFPATDATPSQGRTKIMALPRLQVLVVSSALPEVLQEVERWIKVLDRQDASEQENLYFYNVRHSTAAHLAEALPVFFNNTKTTSRKPRTSATQSVSAKAAPVGSAAPPPSPPSATARNDDDEGNIFASELIIYADNEQNRLTIRTTQRAYTMAEALLKRLDMPPRQVMIQAIVADISLSEKTEFGFSYAAQTTYQDYLVKYAVLGAGALSGTGFPPTPAAFTDGMALMFEKGDDRIGFLRAVAGDTNVSVLSAPQILATNDNEAIISVGDRVPIVTGDYSDVGVSDGTIRRNIEYTDTGVTLTVTPHITAGNEVKLDVVQEVSDAVKTESSGIDSPTIQTRRLSTSLVVPDGGTVLFGGLIKNKETKSQTGIPVLMKLPLVGALFRSNAHDEGRSELLVLITANVVQDESDTERLARRYQAALKKISEKLDM
ncbi:MAG: secretin N-terminal domain-containing protein [Lentisphaeria bacterium]|nr:secretin N-terminal domain-containing protein [Lentisphaeria bacterium]